VSIDEKLFFHECEIKYRISEIDKNNISEELVSKGFALEKKVIETDYTPDVEGFLCRKNNLMLRIRLISGTQNDCLVTLKIKQQNNNFQDNLEIEYYDSDFNKSKYEEIKRIIEEKTKYIIPVNISCQNDIDSIMSTMNAAGFTQNRILSQKKRTIYSNGKINVSFDLFPNDIGQYMEIEAGSPESLEKFVTEMNFDSSKIEPLNYGKLIQKKQKSLSEKDRRICCFEKKTVIL
jgi:adenylate cyclase class IV